MVIHNPALPLNLPTPDEKLFAIVNISGTQHKVMKDDIVLSNYLKGYKVNDQVVFDGVLLVGSHEYTLLGRPTVESAKVYATVEEQTELEKCLVFKKRRRKTYQKTMQFRHLITSLRIDKIDVDFTEQMLQRAVGL